MPPSFLQDHFPRAASAAALPVLGALLLGAPPALGADNVNGNLIVFNDDGGWSWYMDERAIVDKENGTVIVNSVASSPLFTGRNGDVEGVAYHLETGRRQRFVLADNFEEDDHDAAGLLMRPDGKYLAVYARHGSTVETLGDYFSRSRVSSNAHDVSAWEPEVAFDWQSTPFNDYEASYSNVYHLSTENRVYNFVRVTHRSPNSMISDDLGATWTFGGQLTSGETTGYSNGYFKFASNGVDRIYFLGTEQHPRDFNNSVYAGYVSGGRSYRLDGTVVDEDIFDIDAVDPSVVSPATNRFTLVLASDPEDGTQHKTRFWTADLELDLSGNPYALFTARADDIPVNTNGYADHLLFYARWDGAAWQAHEVADMGGQLTPSEQDYTGVAALVPGDPNTIYVSSPHNPVDWSTTLSHEIYKGVTANGGQSWEWTAITSNSASDNFRPIVPAWDAEHTAVLWLRGSMRSSQNYDLSVVGVIETSLEHLGPVTYVDATAVNTELADGTPLAASGPDATPGAVDGNWHWRSEVGNSGDVLTSADSGYEDAPALKTTLTGLADGSYDVFAYFWAQTTGDWYLTAGFEPADNLVFRFNRSTLGLLASTTADNVQQAEREHFDADVTLESGGAFLYRAYVGRRQVSGGAAIDVFIDDFNNPSFVDESGARLGQTWYDGLGYAPVLEGPATPRAEPAPPDAGAPDAAPPVTSSEAPKSKGGGGCSLGGLSPSPARWLFAFALGLTLGLRRRGPVRLRPENVS